MSRETKRLIEKFGLALMLSVIGSMLIIEMGESPRTVFAMILLYIGNILYIFFGNNDSK